MDLKYYTPDISELHVGKVYYCRNTDKDEYGEIEITPNHLVFLLQHYVISGYVWPEWLDIKLKRTEELIEVLVSSEEILDNHSVGLNGFNGDSIYNAEKVKVFEELMHRGKHWSDIKTYNYVCGSMAPLSEVEDKSLPITLRIKSVDAYKVIIELKAEE